MPICSSDSLPHFIMWGRGNRALQELTKKHHLFFWQFPLFLCLSSGLFQATVLIKMPHLFLWKFPILMSVCFQGFPSHSVGICLTAFPVFIFLFAWLSRPMKFFILKKKTKKTLHPFHCISGVTSLTDELCLCPQHAAHSVSRSVNSLQTSRGKMFTGTSKHPNTLLIVQICLVAVHVAYTCFPCYGTNWHRCIYLSPLLWHKLAQSI